MNRLKFVATFDYSSAFLNRFQRIVSNPLFFLTGLLGASLWMIVEALVPNPFDSPKSFYPFLILVVTILGYWIESAMKVTQARQSAQAQAQLDRLETMAKDSNRRDVVIQSLITALDDAVDALIKHLEGEEVSNESPDLRSSDGADTLHIAET